jgi:hypothetical protein
MVLKGDEMHVNKMLESVAEERKVGSHVAKILLKTIHLWSNTIHTRSSVVEITTLIVIQMFSESGITEQGHSIPGTSRGRGLNHLHKTVCPLTSPISNRQHRQLKMETYLKVRVGVLTRWVARRRVGRRHCRV